MAFMFENLQVYQKTIDLIDRVTMLTEQFPRGYYFLVDQLNRAALSITTNLAEGNGRFTKSDRENFFTIARGSVQECVPLLEIARRRGFIPDAQHVKLRGHLEEVTKMISGPDQGTRQAENMSGNLRVGNPFLSYVLDHLGPAREVRLTLAHGLTTQEHGDAQIPQRAR